MGTSVIDHVLTVEEVRTRLKDVNDAALHQGAVIYYGDRGTAELVIMSKDLFQSLVAEQARAAAMGSGPYASFNRAIAEGRLGGRSERAPRRRMRGVSDTSSLPVEQMVAVGRDARAPKHRRRPANS